MEKSRALKKILEDFLTLPVVGPVKGQKHKLFCAVLGHC